MRVLEKSQNGMIARCELEAAIQNISETKQIYLDPVATEAFVTNVFTSADSSNAGTITRANLHQTLE